MAKDAISKRLKDAISLIVSAQDMLDGGSPAGMFEHTEPRASTFKIFGLDPKSPRDRQFLLCLLDEIIFGKGKAGAPRKWGEWERGKLEMDVVTINHGSTKKKSDREICLILKKDKDKKFNGRYANIKPEALRHQLRNIK